MVNSIFEKNLWLIEVWQRVLRTIIEESGVGPVSSTLNPMAGGPMHSSDALMEMVLGGKDVTIFSGARSGEMLVVRWTWLRSGGFQAVLVQCQEFPALEISHGMFLSLHRTYFPKNGVTLISGLSKSHQEWQNCRVKDISFVSGILHFLLLSGFPCLEPEYIVILLCFWCCAHHTCGALWTKACSLLDTGIAPGPGSGVDSFWIQISRASCIPFHFACLKEEAKGSPPFASRAECTFLKVLKYHSWVQLSAEIELYKGETYKGEIYTK